MIGYIKDRHIANKALAEELLAIQQGSAEDAIALLDDTEIFAQDDRDEIIAEIARLANENDYHDAYIPFGGR